MNGLSGILLKSILDSLNCLYSDSILITSPDSIQLYITENSGVLYANASGGVPPYSFSWFNIGNQLGNGETHTVTYIGDYYCVAYDNQHCQSDTAFYSNIILGINQSPVNGLLVYPNPTNGNIFFNLYFDKVEVYSLNGQKLLSFKNVNMLEISLEKGLYLVCLYKEDKSSTRKLIIN